MFTVLFIIKILRNMLPIVAKQDIQRAREKAKASRKAFELSPSRRKENLFNSKDDKRSRLCYQDFLVNFYLRRRSFDLPLGPPPACLVLRLCEPSGSASAAKNWRAVRSPQSTRTLPLFRRASTPKMCPTSSIGAPWRSAKRRGGG